MTLYIFDLDGTLVRGVGVKIPNRLSQQEFIPGVIETCDNLREEGHTLAIASNQGGVAFGFGTLNEAEERLRVSAEMIGAKAWHYCPYHSGGKIEEFRRESFDRKPNPGMIFRIMLALEATVHDVIFVGDMDTDKMAANRAGVAFKWAHEFFGWEQP
jgi:D-glycero-D-manno-heptose 1,7-bisphosphate phosphatase